MTKKGRVVLADFDIAKPLYDNSSIEMYSNKTGKEGVYGVMVPVPTNSYVEITVEVENISNGYVQFGIISEGDSLKDADGAFAIIYPPDENGVLKRVDLYTMTKGKCAASAQNGKMASML